MSRRSMGGTDELCGRGRVILQTRVLLPCMPSANVVIGGGWTYISPEHLSSSASGLGDPGVESEERTCSLRKEEYHICIMLKE